MERENRRYGSQNGRGPQWIAFPLLQSGPRPAVSPAPSRPNGPDVFTRLPPGNGLAGTKEVCDISFQPVRRHIECETTRIACPSAGYHRLERGRWIGPCWRRLRANGQTSSSQCGQSLAELAAFPRRSNGRAKRPRKRRKKCFAEDRYPKNRCPSHDASPRRIQVYCHVESGLDGWEARRRACQTNIGAEKVRTVCIRHLSAAGQHAC